MTRLVLVEGIPGAGKSSTCQHLRRRLHGGGTPSVWWHEEQKHHPVYCFHDGPSLGSLLDALEAGRHSEAIDRALVRWRAFADEAAARDEVVLVDSTLFGYLTWTLFWYAVPEGEIARYVAQVEETIAPLRPRLVYLRVDDVAVTLGRATTTRGDNHREMYVQRAERSALGRERGLRGFEGLVAYWEAYRDLSDRLFAASTLEKLLIASDVSWPERHERIDAFLSLATAPAPSPDLEEVVGDYDGTTLRVEGGDLYAYDLPDRWHRLRLVPLGGDSFEVESLPHVVTFERDANGNVAALRVRGPEMLFSPALDRRASRSTRTAPAP